MWPWVDPQLDPRRVLNRSVRCATIRSRMTRIENMEEGDAQRPAAIDIMRTVFPVLALHPERAGETARPDFFGTAFAVAPGVFMTAAHVVANACAEGRLAIGGPADSEGHSMGAAVVERYERFDDRDVALLFSDVSAVTLLNVWMVRRVQVLTDLNAFGYPHAVTWSSDGERLNVVFRAYKGHVITIRGFERLPDEPSVYEISCPFPVGLSGAPLLLNQHGSLALTGIVLGTSTVTYGGVDQVVGIGMIADQIVRLKSTILGGELGDRLSFDGAFLVPDNWTLRSQ